MKVPDTVYTHHARQSMGNRAVKPEDVDYVLDHGSTFPQRAGRTVFFCGKRTERASCRNLAIVIGADGAVVTAIRTNDPSRLKANAARGRSVHI